MNFANYFTLIRIGAAPLFLGIYLAEIPPSLKAIILFVVLAAAEFTDVLDGYIARKFNQVTDLGKLLDPMADSLFRLSIFLTYTEPPVNLPLALVLLFLYRDSAVTVLRSLSALRGFALAARPSGKIKAFLQGVSSLLILGFYALWTEGLMTNENLTFYSIIVTTVAALWSLLSLVDYFFATQKFLKN
jgi:CDP-diacylglycerol---glycerol-3-phosphate 3-phosphatidyltransferase